MNTCGTEPDCAKPDTDQPQQQTHKPKARAHAKDGLRAEVPGTGMKNFVLSTMRDGP